MGRSLSVVFGLALLLVGAREASASFHLMKVVEVYPGSPAAPAAQYVELQMYFGGQTFVSGTSVAIYSATNAELGRFTFPGNMANGADQSRILIATTQAQTFFNVTANLTMTNILPLTGGKVCFEAGAGAFIDCVAWGNHVGGGAGAGSVGTPVSSVLGLRPGRAIARRLDVSGSPSVLEGADDTENSANDWRVVLPAPRNNAGSAGVIPPSVCGNSSTESIESCDDGGMSSGDGCDSACLDEACGDTLTNDTNETCDDGNLTNGDGCDNNCKITACRNGIVTAGEVCDDGNSVNGDGCDNTCRTTGCGSGVVTGAEVCDDGNLTSGDGCDANCTITACGNGIVTTGEDCEPPSAGNCDASCQLGCSTAAECADTDPCTTNERCDATNNCAVDPTPTDDNEPCTIDSCGVGGVVHAPEPDGMTCTLTAMPTTRALCVDAACVVARCGDGFVDANAPGGSEACDDGNDVGTDACTNTCTVAACGDGVIHNGAEQCDDGNNVDTDACTSACMVAACGDSFLQPGEQCDDGNLVSGDGCTAECIDERCGDHIEQFGEQCDDGNEVSGDGCSATCTIEDDQPPPRDEAGGCCGTARGAGSSAWLAALVLGALATRRRRRGRRRA